MNSEKKTTMVKVTGAELVKLAEEANKRAAAAVLAENLRGKALKRQKPAELAGVSDKVAEEYAKAGYGKSDPA